MEKEMNNKAERHGKDMKEVEASNLLSRSPPLSNDCFAFSIIDDSQHYMLLVIVKRGSYGINKDFAIRIISSVSYNL